MADRPAPAPTEPGAPGLEVPPGRAIRWASWIGTIVFVITAVASTIAPDTFIAAGVATSMILFFAGIGIFLWAYAVAVNRSRTDLIGMGGLFFLAGTAPRAVQRSLLGSLAVEVLVGLVTASVHPFTPLAFGVLAWMYGLALCGLWAARYGTFPPRPPQEKRRRGRDRPGTASGSTDKPATDKPASGKSAGGKSGSGRSAGARSGSGRSAGGKSARKPSGRTTPKSSGRATSKSAERSAPR